MKSHPLRCDSAMIIISVTFTIGSSLLVIYFFRSLPEKIPLYFNWPSTDKEGTGSKDLLWLLPVLSILTTLIFFILSRKFNNGRKFESSLLSLFALLFSGFFFLLTAASIYNGRGNNVNFNKYFYPYFPLLIIALSLIITISFHIRNKRSSIDSQ